MLCLFFNPYPGMSDDYESGKKSLLATAYTYRELFKNLNVKAYDPEGSDSIEHFSIAEDKKGVHYTPSSYIRDYSGRDREIVKHFFLMFANGSRLKNDDLLMCKDWVLYGLEFSAPILEYALRQDGMAVTISDDCDWKDDFYYFIDQPHKLPNIHGQHDCRPINNWITNWLRKRQSFKSILEYNFNILFLTGSTNTCFPSRHEEDGVINALIKARKSEYKADGDLIKHFSTKYGNILELRAYVEGVRIFFTIDNARPVIGGFYRKSASISQNKAGEYSAKRLKDQNYL